MPDTTTLYPDNDSFIVDQFLAIADWQNERRMRQEFGLLRRYRPVHFILSLGGLGT